MHQFFKSSIWLVLFVFFGIAAPVMAEDADRDTLDDFWESNNGHDPAIPHYLVGVGWLNTCVKDDSGVSCFGSVSSGQDQVPALTNPRQVVSGLSHVCALDDSLQNGGVVCWGSNSQGQLDVPAMTGTTVVSVAGVVTPMARQMYRL
jgi:hypothetical protein